VTSAPPGALGLIGLVLALSLTACTGTQAADAPMTGSRAVTLRQPAAQPAGWAQTMTLGGLAPDFILPTSAGAEWQLASELEMEGSVVMIFLPNTTCPRCKVLLDPLAQTQADVAA
jgi:hypothetical protein